MDLRTTFDQDAQRYNRYRPHYPAALFDALVKNTGIGVGSRLLEIGPGTGQATKPLALLGADITAIELGDDLAQKARQELRQYQNASVVAGSFEDADLPAAHYDLIYSATAFHWVKDEYKFTKTAALLKPGGYLAIIHTEHVSDGAGDAFHAASQPIYDTFWPPHNRERAPVLPALRDVKPPFIDTNFFALQSFRVFPEVKNYTAQEYAGLLSTYSPVIALPAARGQRFLASIQELINQQFGGKLEKLFAFTLAIAHKK